MRSYNLFILETSFLKEQSSQWSCEELAVRCKLVLLHAFRGKAIYLLSIWFFISFLCIKCFQFNCDANLLSFEKFFSFKSTLGMVTMIRYKELIWHFDFAESKNIPSLFWTLKHFEYINTSSSLLPSKSIEILNELLNFKFV